MIISRRQIVSASAGSVFSILTQPTTQAGKAGEKSERTLNLGFMVWRIGDILDFDKQVAWVADAGFDSISFHASAGEAGKWRGVEPASADAKERRRIRDLLARFALREIHAPFEATIRSEMSSSALEKLEEVLRFAGDVGAEIVTVHANPPAQKDGKASAAWHRALDRLDAAAAPGTRIGLELNRGFDWLREQPRRHIGITLDVGHMYLRDSAGLRPYGTVGNLIRSLDKDLIHLHVHDYNGAVDHIEIGTGRIDFDDCLRALREIAYRGALCLELNPDRCPPEGIRRSAEFLRRRAAALKR